MEQIVAFSVRGRDYDRLRRLGAGVGIGILGSKFLRGC